MCGIYGAFRRAGSPLLDPRAWEHTGEAMRRRGPDDGGLWCNGEALMGARRLAITDFTPAAAMPFRSADGRYVLTFNGELYGHLDYRRDLSARGWSFTTASDTETLLAALVIHGAAILDGLNGMFTLGLFDTKEHRLLLARDHAGIKPLYVGSTREMFVFCSEFDTLIASPARLDRSVDPAALVQYLDFGHIFAPRSLLRHVEMLEPGERREYSSDGSYQRNFDCLRREVFDYIKDEDADEALEASLQSAVRRQSRSAASVGYLLSGGIDSRLLASLGSDLAAEPLQTFSVGVEGSSSDERAEAAAEARLLRSVHRDAGFAATSHPGLFEDVITAIHEPLADEGILPALLVSEIAQKSVRVVLSGEGADELLFGYTYRHQTANWPTRTRAACNDYLQLYREFPEIIFDACFPGAHKLRNEGHPAIAWARPGDGEMEWMRAIELHTYLPFVLLKTDRASMHHSVETRVPYLDKEVVRTALQIRPQALFDPLAKLGKLPSHRLLGRRHRQVAGPKRGFTAPVEEWIRSAWRPQLELTVHRLRGLSALDIDPSAIRKLATDHCDGRIDAGMALWRFMILDHWADRVGI